MARPLRLEHPGAIWHVTSRGNERRAIVRSDADRRMFVECLGEAVTIRQRSHSVTRKAVAQLASEESGLTFAATGEWLGITGAAAAYLARESKQREQSDPVYAAVLRSIRRDLAVPESEMGRLGM